MQRTIGVNVTNAAHPSLISNGAQTDYLDRYWTFSDDQAGNGTYTYAQASLQYSTNAPSDVNGTIGNVKINFWNGSIWTQLNTNAGVNPVLTTNAYDQATAPLGNNDFALRVNAQATYAWLPTSGSSPAGIPRLQSASYQSLLQKRRGGGLPPSRP